MRASDLSHAIWRKSSRSSGAGGTACVEVAELPGWVAMRDFKDPAGPVLAFTHAEWRAVLDSIRASEFD